MKRKSVAVAAIALTACIALIACGGTEDDASTPTAEGRVQTATPSANGTANTPVYLGEVPVYPRASMQVNSLAEASGAELVDSPAAPPFIVPHVNVGSYPVIQLAVYDTDDSGKQVLEWYRTHLEPEWSFEGGGAGEGAAAAVWTRDGGEKAIWVVVHEGAGAAGKSVMYLWSGS